MPINVKCEVCGKEQHVSPSRSVKYRTCSFRCLGILNKAPDNCVCETCGKHFHRKPYARKKVKNKKLFCSRKCLQKFNKTYYLGANNPNYRAANRDTDGYKLDYIPSVGRVKLHHYITFTTLNISKLPKGYCVHHRDCDIDNNSPENLALLTAADHRWLHKQFGNATLWAYCNKEVSEKELVYWANDKERTISLINKNLTNQTIEFIEVDELSSTERGSGGYGSTDKK